MNQKIVCIILAIAITVLIFGCTQEGNNNAVLSISDADLIKIGMNTPFVQEQLLKDYPNAKITITILHADKSVATIDVPCGTIKSKDYYVIHTNDKDSNAKITSYVAVDTNYLECSGYFD